MSSFALRDKSTGHRKESFPSTIKSYLKTQKCIYYVFRRVLISLAMIVIALRFNVNIRDVIILHKTEVLSEGALKQNTRFSRSRRFPSVEQRVQLYMSDWYLPRCQKDGNKTLLLFSYKRDLGVHRVKNPSGKRSKIYNFSLTDIPVDTAFSLDYDSILNCSKNHTHNTMKKYCIDVINTLFPVLGMLGWNVTSVAHGNGQAPFLLQFGDSDRSAKHGKLPLPVIKKFRTSMTREQINIVTGGDCYDPSKSATIFHGIIWKLGSGRHYGAVPDIPKLDIKWKKKKNKAVFRGSLTGYTRQMNEHKGYNKSDVLQQCLWTQRCRLVYQYYNSTLLDARLTNTKSIPESLNDVYLIGKKMEIQEMLSYKAIIFLEGNDVSSGLKWGLYSQSVVLMPRPTVTSWAMEELLEPWVHYVPIKDDLSDVEEKIRWVLDNDNEAYKISKRANQWIDDLVFHPDANKDDQKIYQEILRRYNYHWSHDLNDIF